MRESLIDILSNYLLPIFIAFFIAWLVQRSAKRLALRFMQITDYAPQQFRPTEERQRTLHDLLSSTIGFIAYLFASIFVLGLFVDTTTLVWVLGLLSAGFGLGARPLISDFLTGIGFIFEDTFDVGEKVEILGVEGVIEKINLRTTFIRAPSGELYVIPNGEIRTIRNFSRGRFSTSNVTLKIAATDLQKTLALLEGLRQEAAETLPDLLEPWQVISQSGQIGEAIELTLLVKTRFGKGAESRPRLLAFIHQRLAEAEIKLAG